MPDKPERATMPEEHPLPAESQRAWTLRHTAETITAQFEHLARQEAEHKGLPPKTLLDYIAAIVHQRFLERRVST